MNTYTEQRGHKPFNWIEALESMATPFPLYTWEDLSYKATAWPTCACGQLDAWIPRSEIGMPRDIPLVELGLRFALAVDIQSVDRAIELFHDIEARAAELLALEAYSTSYPHPYEIEREVKAGYLGDEQGYALSSVKDAP